MCFKRLRIIILSLYFFFLCFSISADVRIAIFDGAKPVSYVDESGNPAGLFPEVLKEIFRENGENVHFVTGMSFQEAYEMVLAGDVDLLTAIVKTNERQEVLDFNKELFIVSWGQLYIHPDNEIESIMDLENKKIALMLQDQNSRNFLKLMENFAIPFESVYYQNLNEMKEAVLSGDVTAMVSFRNIGLSRKDVKATNIVFSPTQSYIAVKKGGPVHLLRMVDDALASMKQDENSVYQREMRRLTRTKTVEVTPLWLIVVLVCLSLGALVVILFLLLLQIKVKQIKNRLIESGNDYKRLFQSAPDLIVMVAYSGERKWEFIDVNKAFCEKTAYSREELLSMNVDDFMTGEFSAHLKTYLNLLKNNDSFLVESEFPKKNAVPIPVELSVQVFKSRGEQFLLAIARDLSERQEFNSALSAIQQKYTTVADYNHDWEFWLSPQRQFVYNSPSCMRITGYESDEFKNNKNLLSDIVHPDDKSLWAEHVNDGYSCSEQSNSQEERELELRFIKKDGTVIWVEHQCRSVFSPDMQNLGIRGSFRDITKRKSMEEELLQKQKLSSLGILAGGIAHDFNNILAVIKGFSDIGKNHEGIDNDTAGIFDTITRASKRGEHLIEQILDFSTQKVSHIRPVQISTIVKEVYSQLKPTFPENIKIVQKIDNNFFIMADPGQIHRVLMNLCTNARLAMPGGGELSFTARELDKETCLQRFSEQKNRRCMELIIKDNGLGMTEEVKNKAFDPYFTTRKTGEGSGMGLAVVHGLVQQWGGHVHIKSSPNQGTAISLFLPVLDNHPDQESGEVSSEYEDNHSRILLIDDEPMILKLLGYYLEKEGHSLSRFSEVSEALEVFKMNPDRYKLAIIDMAMPGLSGDKLADLFKAINPELPVILCSGASEELTEKLKKESVNRILHKPFTEQQLLDTIADLL